MTGNVQQLTASGYEQWDLYVDQHQDASFYHLSGWKQLIEKVYRHKCYFLMWSQNDQIRGVLPLVEQNSLLFGHSLVSMPICVLGGVVADSPEISDELVRCAKSLADKLNVDYMELRGATEAATSCNEILVPEQQSHVMIGCALHDSSESILAGIKKKQRAVVRQSLNNGLTVKIESNVDNLYHIYSTSVRNLGTPVFPKQSFVELKKIFGSRCEIFTVSHQHKPISSVMSFYYKGHVLPHYGGGIAQARAFKSNDFMYYQLMCHAQKKGCHYFDFGRSKIDSGSYRYKKHWGMDIKPMCYQYYLVKSAQLPALSANNPKFKMLIKLWQKLPLVVSQQIGPMLAKYLG
jgi:FemAB-related protein (PEP-CTERM system-associated)